MNPRSYGVLQGNTWIRSWFVFSLVSFIPHSSRVSYNGFSVDQRERNPVRSTWHWKLRIWIAWNCDFESHNSIVSPQVSIHSICLMIMPVYTDALPMERLDLGLSNRSSGGHAATTALLTPSETRDAAYQIACSHWNHFTSCLCPKISKMQVVWRNRLWMTSHLVWLLWLKRSTAGARLFRSALVSTTKTRCRMAFTLHLNFQ